VRSGLGGQGVDSIGLEDLRCLRLHLGGFMHLEERVRIRGVVRFPTG
jgi:hypothetical protein